MGSPECLVGPVDSTNIGCLGNSEPHFQITGMRQFRAVVADLMLDGCPYYGFWTIDNAESPAELMSAISGPVGPAFDILLVDQDLWKTCRLELGEARYHQFLKCTQVVALAPLGTSGASRSYRESEFHDWMPRPIRVARLADALTAALPRRDALAMS